MIKSASSCKALLLDLDGTLLELDLDRFIPTYVESLSKRFAQHIDRHVFAAHLFGATRVMVENENPASNNKTVFYDEFCRRIGRPYEVIKPLVEDFYRFDFPALRCFSAAHPYAQAVVSAARAFGSPDISSRPHP